MIPSFSFLESETLYIKHQTENPKVLNLFDLIIKAILWVVLAGEIAWNQYRASRCDIIKQTFSYIDIC